ncbi:hypothetical protein M3Y97_00106300 [Aphelenchoides bicaudatus]|nr:hypothetical protein M3Y97_00106300 [Aphelenchoides bicaudatus]
MNSCGSSGSVGLSQSHSQSHSVRGYQVKISLNGKDPKSFLYWLQETSTIGIWVFSTHVFERQLEENERIKFLKIRNDTELETKWSTAFSDPRQMIKIKSASDNEATLTYLSEKMALQRINDIKTVSQRHFSILKAFNSDIKGFSGFLDEIHKERQPVKRRIIEKPGTNQQSHHNRNLRKRPNVQRGSGL